MTEKGHKLLKKAVILKMLKAVRHLVLFMKETWTKY